MKFKLFVIILLISFILSKRNKSQSQRIRELERMLEKEKNNVRELNLKLKSIFE
jgi:hypothetical protein